VVIRRALGMMAAVVAILAAATVMPAAPAQAASPQILMSTDGIVFVPVTAVDLFDDLDLIVPGDTMDARLWLRNDSSTPALVRVAVTGLAVTSPAFGSAVTLSSTMNGASYASSVGALTDCQVVVQAQTVGAGSTVRIDFEVTMDSATGGLDAQGATASLGFIATAHDAAAGPFPDADGCSSSAIGAPRPGSLAWTGSEVMPTILVALALLGMGALFTVLRRRRRDDETQES
jgi:hypothetical protein